MVRKKVSSRPCFYVLEDNPDLGRYPEFGTAMLDDSGIIDYLFRGYRLFEMPCPGMVEITSAKVIAETRVIT